MILETLVFDESQITSPTNGLNPKWGGPCHTLSGEAGRTIVIIREKLEDTDETDLLSGRHNDKD